MNCITAVPAWVSCAVPSRWAASQKVAVASQKFTWPVVRGFDPAVTVAVAVTSVPEATVVTGLLADVRDRLVVEAVCAALTFTGSATIAIREPEVPVIVTVPVTGVAVSAAVKVRVLAPEEGFGEKEAVTPLGRPLAV